MGCLAAQCSTEAEGRGIIFPALASVPSMAHVQSLARGPGLCPGPRSQFTEFSVSVCGSDVVTPPSGGSCHLLRSPLRLMTVCGRAVE